VLPADVVVSNADAGTTYTRLLRNQPKKRWTAPKLMRSRWSMGLFVWYFGTRRAQRGCGPMSGTTPSSSGRAIASISRTSSRRGKLAEDMSLYVHRPSVTDPSVAPVGDDTFYVLSPVPHLGHKNGVDWATEAEPYRQKMLKVLEDRLLPGCRRR
jgi:phytoene desaturase